MKFTAAFLAGTGTGDYAPIDASDQLNCCPNFVALIYPAYMGSDGHVAPDVEVHGPIPPLFICQADDDTKYIPGTKIYDAALTAAHVPHVFADYPQRQTWLRAWARRGGGLAAAVPGLAGGSPCPAREIGAGSNG